MTSTQTHAGRVGEDDREHQPAGSGSGDRPLGQPTRVRRSGNCDAEDCPDEKNPVRYHPSLEIGERDRREHGDEHHPDDRFGGIAVIDEGRRHKKQPDGELGEWVAR